MTLLSGSTPITELPGQSIPYVIEAGSGRAHQVIDQVGRCVVGAEESNDVMSVMTLIGPKGRPVPLHYHDGEYEYFFCFDGVLQLWTNEESRLLTAGDFGYVPPGTVHSFQLHRNGSGFVGPVVPAGWERFFDLCGTPYSGAAYPPGPYGPPPFEKFQQAEVEFKMKYRPDLAFAAPTNDAADDTLPGEEKPYFLRRGEGVRHVLNGQLQTALCRSEETGGTVAMTTLEMSKGAGLPAHVHEHTHETLLVLDGRLNVVLDGEDHATIRGDAINIPQGCVHSYTGDGHLTRVLSMSAPGGLERLLATAGEPTDQPIFGPDPASAPDLDRLRDAAAELDVTFT